MTTTQHLCLQAVKDGRVSHRISAQGSSDVFEDVPKWANGTDERSRSWRPVTLRTFKSCLQSGWIIRGPALEDRWFRYVLTERGEAALAAALQ